MTEKERVEHVTVPDFVNDTGPGATAAARKVGLVPVLEGNGKWVKAQMPQAGTQVPVGSKVVLAMSSINP